MPIKRRDKFLSFPNPAGSSKLHEVVSQKGLNTDAVTFLTQPKKAFFELEYFFRSIHDGSI
ncbi:MAG TPA: hypothetical protein VIM67_05290, partial [Terriglobus sp.]